MKKSKIIIMFFIFIILGTTTIYANMLPDLAPNPDITIYLKNMNQEEYIIDLLVKPEDEEKFFNEIQKLENRVYDMTKYNTYKNMPLYKYDEDGWLAIAIRNGTIDTFSRGAIAIYDNPITVSSNHQYISFNLRDDLYYDSNEFRVILQCEDGSIKTSEIITKPTSSYKVYLDVNTMQVEPKYLSDFKDILSCMAITIVIELAIAFIMKINYIKQIIITNIITQLLAQSLRLLSFYTLGSFILIFNIAELIVFVTEYTIYKKLFKDLEKNKILKDTIIANLITAILTFII